MIYELVEIACVTIQVSRPVNKFVESVLSFCFYLGAVDINFGLPGLSAKCLYH